MCFKIPLDKKNGYDDDSDYIQLQVTINTNVNDKKSFPYLNDNMISCRHVCF